MKRIILLGGPTASGKSATALEWARVRGGEIINADSMQLYRELRELTARPTPEEETVCPHHLYGVIAGNNPCSAEDWRELALPVIERIWQRGKVPIIVGGTGLYLKSLTEGLAAVPEIKADIRRDIRAMVSDSGAEIAHECLTILDPVMAGRLAPGDSQRIARALEVILSTGKSLDHWQRIPAEGGLDTRDDVVIERNIITIDRTILYPRCDRRFWMMVEQGQVIEEVRQLLTLNYSPALPVMKALGVPQITRYLRGEIAREDAITLSQTATRQFAKRQLTWFRNQCSSWNLLELKY